MIKLSSFQNSALKKLSLRKKTILNMGCGMGKTVTSLVAAQLNPQVNNFVVVGPPVLQSQWEKEYLKLTCTKPWLYYSYFKKNRAVKTDMLIFDESHKYMKHWKRNRFWLEWARRTPHVILLTATSMLNTPSDLYWMLKICGAWSNSLDQFKFQFGKGKRLRSHPLKVVESGFSNMPQLKALFNSCAISISRPIKVTIQNVNLGKAKIPYSKDFENYSLLESLLATYKSRDMEYRAHIRRYSAKFNKIVLFFSHTDLGREAYMNFKLKPLSLMIDGSTPFKKRYKIIQSFEKAGKAALYMNLGSCSEGINITSAESVFYLQTPWSPGAMYQSFMRCYRFFKKSLAVYTFNYILESREKITLRKEGSYDYMADKVNPFNNF